jgi:hypothetical protein
MMKGSRLEEWLYSMMAAAQAPWPMASLLTCSCPSTVSETPAAARQERP